MGRNISKTNLAVLKELLGRSSRDLESFIGAEDDVCDIPKEVRDVASPYLSTWVAGPLGQALALLDRITKEDGDE